MRILSRFCPNLYLDLKRMFRQERSVINNFLHTLLNPDFMVIFIYRIAHALYRRSVPLFPKFLWLFSRLIFSCDIDYRSDISGGCRFSHALGIVIGLNVKIGKGATIFQQATLGGNFQEQRNWDNQMLTQPVIGDYVMIGPGARILGPVIVGSSVIIGSNAVITKDIPNDCVVVGYNKIIYPKRDILTKMLETINLT